MTDEVQLRVDSGLPIVPDLQVFSPSLPWIDYHSFSLDISCMLGIPQSDLSARARIGIFSSTELRTQKPLIVHSAVLLFEHLGCFLLLYAVCITFSTDSLDAMSS